MKVLHLITWLVPGGIEKWLLSMLEEMPRNECAMDIACKGMSVGPLATDAEATGARVLHCPLTPAHAGFARQLKAILREGKYDIVHNHLANYSGFGTWICQKEGVPVIASYHNTQFAPQTWTRRAGLRQLRDLYSQRSVRYALQKSQYVTGCSEAVLESLKTYSPREANWQVLPYGVEVPPVATENERTNLRIELGWPADALVVLHVGRFIEQKNHVGLLEIFERVSKEVPSARLLLVGEGPLQSQIESVIVERGLTGRALCVGVRNDVPHLMSRSDLFLFPSVHEGFGLVAIEANGAGLPVVASRIPGLTEAVSDETARLHSPHDYDAMTASTLTLLRDPALRARLGQAGRARVSRQFTRPASAENLLRLYRECHASYPKPLIVNRSISTP